MRELRSTMKPRIALLLVVMLLIAALGCSDDLTTVPHPRYSVQSDSSFTVADSSVLEISNFAGRIDVKPGSAGEVHVTVTRRAGSVEDLDSLVVDMVQLQNGVHITTDNPAHLNRVSVDLEVTVPADTRPAIQNAAGDVNYTGLAEGDCIFGAGAGDITLRLPPNVNVHVDLTVGVGGIHVGFPVDGNYEAKHIEGNIGTGADGSIVATTGAGSITVVPQ